MIYQKLNDEYDENYNHLFYIFVLFLLGLGMNLFVISFIFFITNVNMIHLWCHVPERELIL